MPNMTESDENTNLHKTALSNSWSIRPCRAYKDEYDDCTSIKARFHQYFIHGESTDCTQWLQDYNNCKRYEGSNGNDTEAGEAIIQSEEERRLKRFKDHFGNTVWQKRKTPPEDWSKPLPEWLEKRNENSYLQIKQMEMEGKRLIPETPDKYCSIL